MMIEEKKRTPHRATGRPVGRPPGKKNTKPQEFTPEQEEFGKVTKIRGRSNSKDIQRLKDRLAEFLCSEDEIKMMIEDLHAIKDPKDRTAARKDLFQFVIPKVTAVDMNATLETESAADALSKLTHTTVMEGALGVGEDTPEEKESETVFS